MQMKWGYGGTVTSETKTITRNGSDFGLVEGYIASFKTEDVPFPDKFERGAFLDSIEEHRQRDARPIRLNFQHNRSPIGGFPIHSVFEDDRGLFGVAEINLDNQLGREVYSLAKQGVLRDFSIGFIPEEWTIVDDTRLITKARIMEGSIVDEPMNPDAQIVNVKNADQADFFGAKDVAVWTDRDLEAALVSTKQFSRSAVKALVGRLREVDPEEIKKTIEVAPVDTDASGELLSELLAELKGFSDKLNGAG
jgi:HK97 family phage prohead protease